MATGTTTNLTTAGGPIEGKPAWSPDSQTIYYASGDVSTAPGANANESANIFKEPANNSAAPTLAVSNTSGAHHFQPSISPDGESICFTLSTVAGLNTSATVMVAPLTDPPSAGTVFANETGGNYNCTWSPDGTRIAYVNGTFTNGALVMKSSTGGGLVVLEEDAGNFDGNPDWAPDGRPRCADTTVNTDFDAPVSIPLRCADTGPAYERTPLIVDVPTDAGPAKGAVGAVEQGDPATVTYTPNRGFTGADSFEIRSRDGIAFGDRRGTVTVNVGPEPPGGPPPGAIENDFRFGKVKKNKKKGTAKLTVNVPGPGGLGLAKTKKVKAAEKRAEAEGSLKLKLKPKGKAKKRLADKGKAKVKAKVTYTPDGGDPSTKSKRIKLVKRG